MEIETPPFNLKGWIWRDYTNNHLDEYDPFAGPIDYPAYQIGKFIIDKLGLRQDSENREWFLPDEDKGSLICELWITNKSRRDEEPLKEVAIKCISFYPRKDLFGFRLRDNI